MVDTEMDEKEEEEVKKVENKNEQSEGHGKMYNALSGIKEGKVIKMNQSTLKRVVDRVINEQSKNMPPAAYMNCVSVEDITEEQLQSLYKYIQFNSVGGELPKPRCS